MEDVTISVPGGKISVWHRAPDGGSESIVLVHGLSGNSRWWTSVIDHLPDDLGIIALDVRGRGESTEAPEPYDLMTIADDIARALDHFGLKKAAVVGYSMGGWIAALFGVHLSQLVERVVLVDGGFPLPRDPEVDPDEVIDAVVGPSLQRLVIDFDDEEAYFDHWKGHPAFIEHWDDSMRPALAHEIVRDGNGCKVRANPEAIQVSAREITVGKEANQAGARLTVPTHLIVVEKGTLDRPPGMIPLQVAEEAAAANPHLTIEYLPDLNHYTLVLGKGAPAVAAAIAPGPDH